MPIPEPEHVREPPYRVDEKAALDVGGHGARRRAKRSLQLTGLRVVDEPAKTRRTLEDDELGGIELRPQHLPWLEGEPAGDLSVGAAELERAVGSLHEDAPAATDNTVNSSLLVTRSRLCAPTTRQSFSLEMWYVWGGTPAGQEPGISGSMKQSDHVLKTSNEPSPWTLPTQSPVPSSVLWIVCRTSVVIDRGLPTVAVKRYVSR